MKNILVGIDFDETTDLLLSKAVEMAKMFNAKLWLLHAAAPNPDFVGYEVGPQFIRDFRASELKYEHKQLELFQKKVQQSGVDADGMIIGGATVDVILEEAKKLHVDLIIIGHHEHGLLYSAFFGNTSSGLIQKSKTAVMVVPL